MSKQGYINQAINNYISSNDNLCLQLNGGWGEGKTHYIKRFIENQTDDEKERIIYFSVYGIDSLKEIESKLNSKIVFKDSDNIDKVSSIMDSMGQAGQGNFLSVITGMFSNFKENYIENDVKKQKNLIFFIDDIERLSNKICLSDFMGFISSNLLDNKHKVVLIGNFNNEKHSKLILEKIVNHNVQFKTNLEIIIELINEELATCLLLTIDKEGIQKWFSSIFEHIFFRKSSSINLRQIKTIASNYKFLEHSLFPVEVYNGKKIQLEVFKSLFLNCLVITKEIKEGNITEKNFYELEQISGKIMSSLHTNSSELKGIPNSLISKYYNINDDFDKNIFYSDTVNYYIMYGVLSGNFDLDKWQESYFKDTQLTRQIINKLAIYNVDVLQQEELKNLEHKLYIEIQNQYITSWDFLSKAYITIFDLDKNGLLLCHNFKIFQDMFEMNIKKIYEANPIDTVEMDGLFYWMENRYNDKTGRNWFLDTIDKYRKNYVINARDELLEKVMSGKIETIDKHLINDSFFEDMLIGIAGTTYIKEYICSIPSNAKLFNNSLIMLKKLCSNKAKPSNKSVQDLLDSIQNNKKSIQDVVALYSINNLIKTLENMKS